MTRPTRTRIVLTSHFSFANEIITDHVPARQDHTREEQARKASGECCSYLLTLLSFLGPIIPNFFPLLLKCAPPPLCDQKKLLFNMLPKTIVDQLEIQGYQTGSWDQLKGISQRHQGVCILFADIPQFADFARKAGESWRILISSSVASLSPSLPLSFASSG